MLTNASVDFERNFYKATRNANLSWSLFLHCSGPYLMPIRLSAVRCQLATRITLRQLPSSQSLCLTLWLAFPSYFRSRRDLESKPFVWFCAKTDKGIVYLADHLHNCIMLPSLYLFTLINISFVFFNVVFASSQGRRTVEMNRSCCVPCFLFVKTSYQFTT